MEQAFLRRVASRRGWRGFVTAMALGAVSALALPPLHILPLLWLTLPVWLLMLGAAPSWRSAAWLGFAFGWGHHVVGLYWITEALLTDPARWWWLVPIAVPAIALPLAAFSMVPALAAWRAAPGWPRLLVLAGAWTGAELLRGAMFTGFPWNLLGTVWAFDALPVQAAAWIGANGLSAVTVLLATLPVLGWRGWAVSAAGLVALAGVGVARLWPEEAAPQPVTLVLVQGNVAQEAKWREESRWPIFRRYLELTRDGLAAAAAEVPPGTRLVAIWPESASPFLLDTDAEARRFAAATLPPDAVLLAGTVRAEFDPDRGLRALFNSLVAIGPDGRVQSGYDKAHLVPFGEYMPLSGWLPIRVAPGAIDFSAGPGRLTMRLPGLPSFSPLICYEVIFSGDVVGRERPDWLVNVTNDAWFGVSSGPYQHLAAARLRAVEEGLPLARVAQTGISAVFDGRGRVVGRLGLAQTGVVVAPLPAARAATAFAWGGIGIPAGIAVILLVAGTFGTRLTRFRRV